MSLDEPSILGQPWPPDDDPPPRPPPEGEPMPHVEEPDGEALPLAA